MKKLQIGDRVKTRHGVGNVVGIDLEGSDVWRYIVKLYDPKHEFEEMVLYFPDSNFCYFPKEVKKN